MAPKIWVKLGLPVVYVFECACALLILLGFMVAKYWSIWYDIMTINKEKEYTTEHLLIFITIIWMIKSMNNNIT